MFSQTTMNLQRVRVLSPGKKTPGPVVYWMSREMRAEDNWALIFSRLKALDAKVPVAVIFCLAPEFLNASPRHYAFLLGGLKETAFRLEQEQIPFFLLQGSPEDQIPVFLKTIQAGILVMDFDPLPLKQLWKQRVMSHLLLPVYEVDAHNIVPCWAASAKREWGAYTFRPKWKKLKRAFLDPFPALPPHPISLKKEPEFVWPYFTRPALFDFFLPGTDEGKERQTDFIKNSLRKYPDFQNDPLEEAQSGLSPYLHFGQISPQRVALEVEKCGESSAAKEAFLEQLCVRRELSDNFCFYERAENYWNALPSWALQTHETHRNDFRDFEYGLDELASGKTHDPLWNAAQVHLRITGKIPGYLRMYWAKKILEWTPGPEKAYETAVYLNDRYSLDGRDPNGYVGILWSLGGLHDRAWPERPVYGKIRSMTLAGCSRKMNVKAYIQRVEDLRALYGDSGD